MANKQTVEELAIAISMESDSFKNEMSTINGLIKKSEKEFKAISKSVENFEKSFTGLDAKIERTSKQIELYNKKLEKQEKEYDKNKKALEDNTRKLEESKTKLQEIENSQGKNSEAWEKQSKEVEKNTNLVSKNSQKIIRLSSDIKTTEGNIEKLTKELKDSETAFNELGNASETLEQQLSTIDSNASLLESEFNKLTSELNETGSYFKKLGADITNLNNKLNTGNATIDAYEKEINSLKTDLNEQSKEYKELENKIQSYTKQMNRASAMYGENSSQAKRYKTVLLGLKDSYNKLDIEINNNKKALNKYQTELNNTVADVNKLSKELKNVNMDYLSKELKKVGDNLKDVRDKAKGVGLAIAGVATTSGAAAVEADDSFVKVKAGLGLTKEEADKVMVSVRNLADKGFDFTEATETITQTKQVLGDLLSSEEIEDFSSEILSISKVFEVDIQDSIKASSSMMRNFKISGQEATDIITYGLQNGLNASGDFLDSLHEYAPQMSALGFTAEQTLGIISVGMKEGSFNTDKLIDGLKEGRLRMSDMNDAATEAVNSIGLNASEVEKNIASGGEVAANQMANIAQKVLDIKDPVEQNKVATALWGTQWEDSGVAMLQAMASSTKGLEDFGGTADEVASTVENSLGNQIKALWNKVKELAATVGESLVPVLLDLAEKITPVIDSIVSWIEENPKLTQGIIIIGGLVTALSPLLMGLGGGFQIVSGMMSIVGGSGAALSGVLGGLSGFALPAIVGALVLVATQMGDNEGAILSLQEKWGGFGVFIGAVMEFISGAVQITLGYIIELVKGGFDIVGAIIDGPGGNTVKDATKRMNENLNLTMEEGMGKLTLTTTRGMSQMRSASDRQLQGTVTSMETIMSAIPNIVDGKYRTASNKLGAQLSKMDYTQISILQGMNDTTKMMFEGIRTGMSVEEASKKVESNLKQMATSGKIDADTMNKDVSSAIEQMKGQMNSKTKEAAKAVDNNLNDAGTKASLNSNKATKNVSNAYANMAIEAKKGSSQVASNTNSDFKNANKSVQQSATDMYNGSKKSYSKMADTAKSEGTRMYLGVKNSAEKMAQSAKSSASDMYRGVTTSTRKMANSVISDWNRIRNAYRVPIRGTITKTTINRVVNQKSRPQNLKKINNPQIHNKLVNRKNIRVDIPNMNIALPRIPEIDISGYKTRGSYYNVQSYNSSLSKVSNIKDNSKLEEKLDSLIVLISSVLSKKEDKTKDGRLIVQLNDSAGRAIAEIIAPYSDVIDEYNQRDPRLSYR